MSNQQIALYLFEELWNNRNRKIIDQIFAQDFEAFTPSAPDCVAADLDGFKNGVDLVFKTFPDMRFIVDDIISENNKIVIRWHGEGKQTHSFFGEPTDDETDITYAGLLILVIENNQIKKAWLMDNSFELAENYN